VSDDASGLGPATPDDELVRALAEAGGSNPRGRRAAGLLFERWHGKVWAWCRRVMDDDDLAGEIAQEVFVELLRRVPAYAERGRFGAWLYVLARNRCLNERKRRARFAEEELGEIFAEAPAPNDPVDAAGRVEMDERVRRACHQHLSAREQEVIWLRYSWGMKVNEITERLGLTNASGARTHLRTAEQKLRRALGGLRAELDGGLPRREET